MSLADALAAFNASTDQKIVQHPTRDGRVTATLPRLGVEAVIQGNITHTVFVTPKDVALVCQEMRLAMAPALTVLDAALELLSKDALKDEA